MSSRKKRPTVVKYKTGKVLVGSCLERLKDLPDASISAIVTDPPYELGFMGKTWDSSGVAYSIELWTECLRVLKPGGHLLAFGGTRTYHRMACAIEDAGFEIRDSLHWIYGSGFPKSHDVSKAIDKAADAEGEWKSRVRRGGGVKKSDHIGQLNGAESGIGWDYAPATDAAKKWQGWGTALKPAHEPIVLARKPLNGTVAANVLAHSTGALNIDGCRVGTSGGCIDDGPGKGDPKSVNAYGDGLNNRTSKPVEGLGRWPANVIFDEAAGEELGEVARFFYCPKPSRAERNAGLESLPEKLKPYGNRDTVPEEGDKPGSVNDKFTTTPASNFHPTVKPVELMRWLVRLITPPGGTVLDPFLGSGTTAVAAILEGFEWVGCEMTADYLPIIAGRVKHAQKQHSGHS